MLKGNFILFYGVFGWLMTFLVKVFLCLVFAHSLMWVYLVYKFSIKKVTDHLFFFALGALFFLETVWTFHFIGSRWGLGAWSIGDL